jgi:hypothetical protein
VIQVNSNFIPTKNPIHQEQFMAIYMQLPGIQGPVTTKGYEGWIQISDLEFGGIQNGMQMQLGKQMDRFNQQPNFGQVVLVCRSKRYKRWE